MKKKLRQILLIDDSEADNYIHKDILEKKGITEKIVVKYKAEDALEYLTTLENDEYPHPELIFLDINMPGMNGWEFLEEYEKLELSQKGEIVVTMLTTSVSPDDKEKAEKNNKLSRFESKPLTGKNIDDIMEKHFPEFL